MATTELSFHYYEPNPEVKTHSLYWLGYPDGVTDLPYTDEQIEKAGAGILASEISVQERENNYCMISLPKGGISKKKKELFLSALQSAA